MKLYTKKFLMLVDILVLVSHQIVNIYIYIFLASVHILFYFFPIVGELESMSANR